MTKLKEIADRAEIIVNGYAFCLNPQGIQVLNLNSPDKATVFDDKFEAIETTMDDIEISIVRKYLKDNLQFLED